MPLGYDDTTCYFWLQRMYVQNFTILAHIN